MTREEIVKSKEYKIMNAALDWYFDNNQEADSIDGFCAGYSQASKDLVEKACEWIHLHIGELNDLYIRTAIREEFIDDFRKAMEEL